MSLLELVVTGKDPGHRWRRHIPEKCVVRIGRESRNGSWAVPWDRCISREHCDLEVVNGGVFVRCLEQARNPLQYRGQFVRACTVSAGDEFRIGETLFQINPIDFAPMDSAPLEERTFDSDDVKHYEFTDADTRLEVLARLPEVIATALSDESLARNIVRLLLSGIPHADAAAVVRYDMTAGLSTTRPLRLTWDGQPHFGGRFQPSRRLILMAIDEGQTKLHVWPKNTDAQPGDSMVFSMDGLDWAFCTPILEPSCRGWCVYVSGKESERVRSGEDLKSDIRFTELLAHITGALRQVQVLERQHTLMGQFFSPAVMEAIATRAGGLEENLAPRELPTTVLFCDMRGFSLRAERSRHDLATLLDRCSKSLGLMTRSIFAYDGVVADFQGDAALGFWGWPVVPDDGPLQACRAALRILTEFKNHDPEDSTLGDFRVGIGIAHGTAVAGKIGAAEQYKVGVFGPVVNLGSRLEGLTKYLRAPILIDEVTADFVRKRLPRESGRCRRLGRILPYGLKNPVSVFQLLPPFSVDPGISDADIQKFELGIDLFVAGQWDEAVDLFGHLPVEDRAKDFFVEEIARRDYQPPEEWDGIVRMENK